MMHVRAMKEGLRRTLGGNKVYEAAAGLFALHSPNLVSATVPRTRPGKFRHRQWRTSPGPLEPAGAATLGQPIDPAVVVFYHEPATFVLGSAIQRLICGGFGVRGCCRTPA